MQVRSLGWEHHLEEGMQLTPGKSLENPMDRGAWWAGVHRVAKNQTRQKQLSTHTCVLYPTAAFGKGPPFCVSRALMRATCSADGSQDQAADNLH